MSGQLSRSGSFSIHSLVEGSEAISEAEEIQEVKHLQRRGDKAFNGKNYGEALRFYSDALEIDENSMAALASRAAAYIEMENFILAQQDAERLLSIMPNHAQGHYLLGVAMDSLGQYREGLSGYLNALELDTDPTHADILASHVASLAHHFCYMPDNLIESLPGMDAYKKLSEVGACLYQAGRHDQCIKVLNAAQKVATKQRGITMKVQLTLANAHSSLKHTDIAISLYQECLSTAVATHDYQYQTKSLVNIASLFLEVGDTHRAIVHYEKLLDLEKEIRGEEDNAPLPAYWTFDLQCALHLNLSIAYKAIGGLEQAVHYARQYTKLLEDSDVKQSTKAQSFHNEGLLHEILGEFQEAVENYKSYLKQSKAAGDRRGVAQAYGCLGSAYAALNNYQLSITYHEQHVALAAKLNDPRLLGQAHEQFGDTRVRFKEYAEAIECYMNTIKSCAKNDLRMQNTALCKIGKTYRGQKKFQYSMYYFEQAKIIAEDFEFADIKIICEYNLACILQHSTQMYEIDQAQKYFERLIPIFEGKINQHLEENTFCPKELYTHLDDCYQGIIHILAKSGYKDEALVYSEALHKKLSSKLGNQITSTKSQSSLSLTSSGNLGLFDAWSIDKITRVISEQNATVLYYTVLPQSLLMWVLQPSHGLVRFYASKPVGVDKETISQQILSLQAKLLKSRNVHELVYDCENRALPDRNTELKLLQKANKQLGGGPSDQESGTLTSEEAGSYPSLATTAESTSTTSSEKQKSPERLLFDLLMAPVYDILSSLDIGSPLVIVPDRVLHACPFNCIKDWNQTELKQRFRITVLPSLYVLDKVTHNELNQLLKQDNVEFQRSQSRLGGIQKVLTGPSGSQLKSPAFDFSSRLHPTETSASSFEKKELNTKRTSNPRLAKSGALKPITKPTVSSVPITAQASRMSLASSKVLRGQPSKVLTPPTSVPLKATKQVGSPTRPEKLMSVHTMTTLTTRTSTNTDIIKANCGVSEFVQVADPGKCVIIGSPLLPESVQLYGEEWKPRRELKKCQDECFKVAEILGVSAVVGEEASKDRLIQELQQATIIHIATYASLEEGKVVMTPNVNRHEKGAPLEHSYIVTSDEIANLSLTAKLVVLSCGWSSQSRDAKEEDLCRLPSAFLLAGAQCVVTLLWAVPNATLQKFYFHFYQALQTGNFVSTAVVHAAKQIQDDNRYSDLSYWAPFVQIGKDVEINLQMVRQAMLDQTIDKVEQEAGRQLDPPPLNPEPAIPSVPTTEEGLEELQRYLGELLIQHERQQEVIPQLILLLDGALKRQHLEENNRKTTHLPGALAHTEAGLKLLKVLGFHFQGRGSLLSEPYIIYPHWNPDNLLVPTYDALRAVLDLVSSPSCARALYEYFPGSQETLSYIIDVLCITKHAPEIQLKVSDMSVRPLWRNMKVKAILLSMGFHQIGPLLNFNNVPSNWKLLNAGLQLLISVSAYKSTTLLHKLDVTLLGGPNSIGKSSITFEQVKLPSLTPALLPRHQLRMSTPWLSTVERPEEMDEKIRVAQCKNELGAEFRQHLRRAKTWHQVSLSSQANESLSDFGRPKTHDPKVKVKAGATSSCQRMPVDEKARLDLLATEQRRDYATYVFQQRLENVTLRHQDNVRKMYLPYVQNV